MKSQTGKKWLGGYIRHGKRGPAFIIERWIDGQRFHVSTKCRTKDAALEQFALFERDPVNYRPGRAKRVAAAARGATLTSDLIFEYERWMLTRPDPATERHAHVHVLRLKTWLKLLGGRDLREWTLRELMALLADKKDHATRIQALRCYCAWARKKRFLLERHEDPTIDMETPRARASKDVRQVAVPMERILKVLPHLPAASRDILLLRIATGWHFSEVTRFAAGGAIERTPGESIRLMTAEGPKVVPLLAVLHVQQKIGVTTNTPILYEEHLQAAERLRALKEIQGYMTLGRHVTAACKAAGVPRFLNWHLRHSVVTHAVEQGANLEHASVFVDHLSVDTTRRFYLQLRRPQQAVPVAPAPQFRVIEGGGGEKTG